MAIVRELLVKIGFQTDKRAINETNKAISGFKTRFALVATSAAFATKFIADAFKALASDVLDSDELARSLNLTLNEFTALQRGFQKFRINDQQVSQVFSNLQKDLNEFRQGYGRLPELIRQTGLDISKDTSVTEYFDKLTGYLQKFENEQDRIKVASEFFGQNLAVKLSDLARDFDLFKLSVGDAYTQLKDAPDITGPLKEYEQSINDITNSFKDVFKTLVVELSPAIQALSEWVKVVTKLYSSLLSFNLTGLKEAGTAGFGLLSSFGELVGNKINSGINYLNPYIPKDNAPMPSMTNNIEVLVPGGTQLEQAEYIADSIQNAVQQVFDYNFSLIQSNNPVVE